MTSRLAGGRWVSTILGFSLAAAGAAFVLRALAREWSGVKEAASAAEPGWIALAALLGSVGMLGIGLNWRRGLALLGGDASRREAVAWYFVGQLGKYVPGGIWPVVGRGELASRGGVDRSKAYGAALLSLGATYLGGVLLLAIVLPIAVLGHRASANWLWILTLIPLGLLSIHPLALQRLLPLLARRTGRPPTLVIPRWSDSVGLVLGHVPCWLAIGGAHWSIGRALGGGEFIDVVTASVLAWVVGFLVIPVPGGIGVREAVFTLAATSLGSGLDAAVAVIARVLFMTVDLGGAGLFLPLLRRRAATSISGRSPPSPSEPPSSAL